MCVTINTAEITSVPKIRNLQSNVLKIDSDDNDMN